MTRSVQISYSDRIEAWDLLKLFAIFLVVYAHSMQYLLRVEPESNPLFLWIISFHMPLFMSLSGLFANKTQKLLFKEYLLRRSRQILLPCLSWSFIILVIIIIMEGELSAFKSFVINSLWFLKSVFVCGLLYFMTFRSIRYRNYLIFLSLVFSQFCWIWNVFMMYPCFLLGVFIFKYLSLILNHRCSILFASGLFFAISSLYVAFTPDFWTFNKGIRSAIFSGTYPLYDNIQFLIGVVVKKYILLLIGLSGSLFFIVLFYVLFNRINSFKLKKIASQGKYTLAVYVIQAVILETLLVKWIQFDYSYFYIFNFMFAPFLSFVILLICLYINSLILSKGGLGATVLLGIPYHSSIK